MLRRRGVPIVQQIVERHLWHQQPSAMWTAAAAFSNGCVSAGAIAASRAASYNASETTVSPQPASQGTGFMHGQRQSSTVDSLSERLSTMGHDSRTSAPQTASMAGPGFRQHRQQQRQAFTQALLGARSSSVARAPRSSRGVRQIVAATGMAAAPALGPGILVEFRKDDRYVLALIKRAEGKRAWICVDAGGQEYTIKLQQVVFVVPKTGHTEEELAAVAQHAQECLDVSLLEDAWEMVQGETGAMFDVHKMSEFLFGSDSHRDCYATHRLLSTDRYWFKQTGRAPPLWQPRPEADVKAIRAQAEAKQRVIEELRAFVTRVNRVRALPPAERPSRDDWMASTDAGRVRALWEYAIRADVDGQTAVVAQSALQSLGSIPSTNAAVALLRDLGVLESHEPVQLYRLGISNVFGEELQAAAVEHAGSPVPDPFEGQRLDVTHQKIYVVDDAGTVEVDDGISCERLPDGRLEVWVHVADPTRYVPAHHPLVVEAVQRTKTCYLPTGMVPMFPQALGTGPFSLQHRQECPAMSVRCVLQEDGAIADAEVLPTIVRPEYKLTYDDVDELLEAATPEMEPELFALNQAAQLRRKWREAHGAIEINFSQPVVKVVDSNGSGSRASGSNASSSTPSSSSSSSQWPRVKIEVQEQDASPSRRMVAEMMILAGEAVGRLGQQAELPLPYRGQAPMEVPPDAQLDSLPAGMCRQAEMRRFLRGARVSVRAAAPHAGLGLQAYVQFTSPIRRYGDLLAHYQIQAWLLRQDLPYDAELLESIVAGAQERGRAIGDAEKEIQQQWVAVYFQQIMQEQPDKQFNALMLTWRHKDKGIARLWIDELALEVGLPVSRPVQPGEWLALKVVAADPSAGTFKLVEVLKAFQQEEQPQAQQVGV